jgi:hypothetical protein
VIGPLIDNEDAFLKALLVECPYCSETPECPLRELRTRPLKDRVMELKNFTPSLKKSVLEQHFVCSHQRLSEMLHLNNKGNR